MSVFTIVFSRTVSALRATATVTLLAGSLLLLMSPPVRAEETIDPVAAPAPAAQPAQAPDQVETEAASNEKNADPVSELAGKKARAQALHDEGVQRKAAADQRFAEESKQCWQKILVNDCLAAAKKRHTAAIKDIRVVEQEGRDLEREVRRQELTEKKARQAVSIPEHEENKADQATRAAEEQAKAQAEAARKQAEQVRKIEEKQTEVQVRQPEQARKQTEKMQKRREAEEQARQRAQAAEQQRAEHAQKTIERERKQAEKAAAKAAAPDKAKTADKAKTPPLSPLGAP